MRVRRRLAARFAAVAAITLAGCGAAEQELASGRQAVLVAAGETAAERTARATAHVVVSMGEQSYIASGEGAVDLAGGRATWTMKVPGQVGTMATVVDGPIVYVELPGVLASIAPGKRWAKLDLAALAEDAGVDPSLLLQGRGTDVRQLLSMLEEVSGDVEVVGRAEVRGAQTTHLRARLDVRRLLEQLGATPAAAAVSDAGISTVPIEVWLDESGRVRRLRQVLDLGALLPRAGGQPAHVETTIELFDFGVSVDVVPPPPEAVADMAEILRARR